jgi:hypothetical protein
MNLATERPLTRIPLQVGTELRIRRDGLISVDNPELELGEDLGAADAILSYRLDAKTGDHVLRLLDPVADHSHIPLHRRGD